MTERVSAQTAYPTTYELHSQLRATSHQLKRLLDRGVVSFRKEGRLAFYRLSDDRVRGLLESGVGHALEALAR